MSNFGDISSSLTLGASESVRRNAADNAFEAFTPFVIPSLTGNSGKFLTNNGSAASWGNPLTVGSPIFGGTNNRVFYQSGGNLAQSGNLTFDGSDLTVAGNNVYSNATYTWILGSALIVGQDGQNTEMFFRGGTSGSNTYGNFTFSAGGGNREFKITNQSSSRGALYITGGSDVQNATNTFVGIGQPSPFGRFHVQQHNASYPVIVAEGASGQSGHLIALMPFGAGSYLSVFDSAGSLAIGHGSPSAAFHVIKTTEQARFGYDGSNYFKVTVGSTGSTVFDGVGTGAKFNFNKTVEFGYDAEFLDEAVGIILRDRDTLTRYRIYIDSGVLQIETA